MTRKQKSTVGEQLRQAVEACPMTRYGISKATGIDQAQLCRFVHGESGLSFRSIDLLCQLLGLELRPMEPEQSEPKQPTRRPNRKAKQPAQKATSKTTRRITKKGGK